jgi:release factor glutamine methyltransferase
LTPVADLLRDATERLRAAGVDSARVDARILLAHTLGVEPSSVLSLSPTFVGEREMLLRFESFLARRIAREPVAYITGTKEFWSLEFDVGPGALIPRPESETLVECVLSEFPDRTAPLNVLDLGVGTGCLLLSALSEYANARGTGIDASREALGWARRNAEKLGLADRCNLRAGNWGDDLSDRFDVVLSNPPYIRGGDIALLAPEIRLYEPPGALDGGLDGLDAYRALGPKIHRLLKPSGLAFLEMGKGQDTMIVEILGRSGLGTLKIARDLAGIGRCVIAEHWTSAEKTVGSPVTSR